MGVSEGGVCIKQEGQRMLENLRVVPRELRAA